MDYFLYLERFIHENGVTIDRSKGSVNPRFPDYVYPVDYGFIPGTRSDDGQGIDVFRGSLGDAKVSGIVCTLDQWKKDVEIKVLYECNESEIQAILDMLPLRILVRRSPTFK